MIAIASNARTVHDTPLSINLGMLDLRVFYGRVVVLYEHLLKELNRQCRLAHSTVADHDHLVGGHVIDRWLFRHGADYYVRSLNKSTLH